MRYWIYISVLIFFSSCKKEKMQRLTLADVVEEQKAEYLRKLEKKCKNEAYVEAAFYVDSLANKWVSDDLLDSLDFPSKPTRPERPDDILEKDN